MDILGVAGCPGPVRRCTCHDATMAVNNLIPCRSFTHLIYIYWLLWYNPLITWKADLFPLRTTGTGSSFPLLSRRTIPYNTHRPNLGQTLFYCMWENATRRTFTLQRSIGMRKCLIKIHLVISLTLIMCCWSVQRSEYEKTKLALTLCCFPPCWLM